MNLWWSSVLFRLTAGKQNRAQHCDSSVLSSNLLASLLRAASSVMRSGTLACSTLALVQLFGCCSCITALRQAGFDAKSELRSCSASIWREMRLRTTFGTRSNDRLEGKMPLSRKSCEVSLLMHSNLDLNTHSQVSFQTYGGYNKRALTLSSPTKRHSRVKVWVTDHLLICFQISCSYLSIEWRCMYAPSCRLAKQNDLEEGLGKLRPINSLIRVAKLFQMILLRPIHFLRLY